MSFKNQFLVSPYGCAVKCRSKILGASIKIVASKKPRPNGNFWRRCQVNRESKVETMRKEFKGRGE